MRKLLRSLKSNNPPRPTLTTAPIDVLANLVADARNRGILDRFLTFLYSVSDAGDRDVARDLLVRHIVGDVSVKEVRAKLRPDARATKSLRAFQELDEALSGDQGARLVRAMRASGPEFAEDSVVAACAEHGVDAFDVRYLSKLVKAVRKSRAEAAATKRQSVKVRGRGATVKLGKKK